MNCTTLERPRRSVLYMPGANARALEKAKSLDADALILDLEDAVAPEKKAEARTLILSALESGYGKREVAVRINAVGSDWYADDIAAFAKADIDALCLPKIESADQVQKVSADIAAAGAADTMAIWAMIETPKGVLAAEDIAAADPRLNLLIMGTSDLAKELRLSVDQQRSGLQYSLSKCVVAARAAGVDIVDGVQLNLDDVEAYTRSCEQGKALGFDGKTLIHPKQIDAANTVFGPSAEAVARAEKIMDAWQVAAEQGLAVVVVDGQLIEVLHVEEAKRTLAIADMIRTR